MENFALALSKQGHHVLHLNLDQTQTASLATLLADLTKTFFASFHYQQPDEYCLQQELEGIAKTSLSANYLRANTYLEHKSLINHIKRNTIV